MNGNYLLSQISCTLLKFQKDKPVQSLSQSIGRRISYPYEKSNSEKSQLWVVGNGNINKTLKFTIDEGKAKEWDLRGFKSYSIDIPTLTNALEQFKKAHDITIDSYSNSTVKHTLMLQIVNNPLQPLLFHTIQVGV